MLSPRQSRTLRSGLTRDITLLILQQKSCGIVMLVLREATLSSFLFPCPTGRLCHTSVNYSFSSECLISLSSFSSIVFSLLPNPLRLMLFHLHHLSYVPLLCQTLFLTIFNCFSRHFHENALFLLFHISTDIFFPLPEGISSCLVFSVNKHCITLSIISPGL